MSNISEYHSWRKNWITALGGSCNHCGIDERLEFDHVDPATKSFEISENWSAAKKIMAAEMAKCQLLCAPCHWKKDHPTKHGTTNKYKKHGCRCDQCKEAQRVAQAAYRERKNRAA